MWQGVLRGGERKMLDERAGYTASGGTSAPTWAHCDATGSLRPVARRCGRAQGCF